MQDLQAYPLKVGTSSSSYGLKFALFLPIPWCDYVDSCSFRIRSSAPFEYAEYRLVSVDENQVLCCGELENRGLDLAGSLSGCYTRHALVVRVPYGSDDGGLDVLRTEFTLTLSAALVRFAQWNGCSDVAEAAWPYGEDDCDNGVDDWYEDRLSGLEAWRCAKLPPVREFRHGDYYRASDGRVAKVSVPDMANPQSAHPAFKAILLPDSDI